MTWSLKIANLGVVDALDVVRVPAHGDLDLVFFDCSLLLALAVSFWLRLVAGGSASVFVQFDFA